MPMPPWSYSSLNAAMTCLRRYYLTRVSKEVVEPQGEHLVWGNRVHSALELRIKEKRPLPEGMEKFEAVAQELESWSDNWVTEERFGLTKELKPTEFFSPEVWCRGVLDVYTVHGKKAVVGDYKTGKVRPDSDQLKLFAAAIFHKYPQVDRIRTAFIWLNHDKKTFEDYDRQDLKFIWGEFFPKLQRLESAYEKNVWPPNPSGLCREWCPVGRDKCEHCGK